MGWGGQHCWGCEERKAFDLRLAVFSSQQIIQCGSFAASTATTQKDRGLGDMLHLHHVCNLREVSENIRKVDQDNTNLKVDHVILINQSIDKYEVPSTEKTLAMQKQEDTFFIVDGHSLHRAVVLVIALFFFLNKKHLVSIFKMNLIF